MNRRLTIKTRKPTSLSQGKETAGCRHRLLMTLAPAKQRKVYCLSSKNPDVSLDSFAKKERTFTDLITVVDESAGPEATGPEAMASDVDEMQTIVIPSSPIEIDDNMPVDVPDEPVDVPDVVERPITPDRAPRRPDPAFTGSSELGLSIENPWLHLGRNRVLHTL